MKRIIFFIAIFGLFIFYIFKNLPVITETFNITFRTSFGFLALALILSMVAFSFLVRMYLDIYRMSGINRTSIQMAKLELRAMAINVLLPTAGISVGMMYGDDARDNGDSPASAISAFITALFVSYTAALLMLSFALIFLSVTGHELNIIWLPAVLLLLLTVGLYMLMNLSTKNKKLAQKIVLGIMKVVSRIARIFGKKIRAGKNVTIFIDEVATANQNMKKNVSTIVRSIGYALLAHLTYIAALDVIFRSLGYHPLYRVLIAGYAVGYLFVVVSPTPFGIGFAEAAMALTYNIMGVPMSIATTASILIRLFNFWLPLLLGFALVQRKNLKEIASETFSDEENGSI